MFGLEAIWRNGHVVGHVRRADFGFAVNKTIAYGYIRDPSGGPVSEPCSPIPSRLYTRSSVPSLCVLGTQEEASQGGQMSSQPWSPADFSCLFSLLSLKETDWCTPRIFLIKKSFKA